MWYAQALKGAQVIGVRRERGSRPWSGVRLERKSLHNVYNFLLYLEHSGTIRALSNSRKYS